MARVCESVESASPEAIEVLDGSRRGARESFDGSRLEALIAADEDEGGMGSARG